MPWVVLAQKSTRPSSNRNWWSMMPLYCAGHKDFSVFPSCFLCLFSVPVSFALFLYICLSLYFCGEHSTENSRLFLMWMYMWYLSAQWATGLAKLQQGQQPFTSWKAFRHRKTKSCIGQCTFSNCLSHEIHWDKNPFTVHAHCRIKIIDLISVLCGVLGFVVCIPVKKNALLF